MAIVVVVKCYGGDGCKVLAVVVACLRVVTEMVVMCGDACDDVVKLVVTELANIVVMVMVRINGCNGSDSGVGESGDHCIIHGGN